LEPIGSFIELEGNKLAGGESNCAHPSISAAVTCEAGEAPGIKKMIILFKILEESSITEKDVKIKTRCRKKKKTASEVSRTHNTGRASAGD